MFSKPGTKNISSNRAIEGFVLSVSICAVISIMDGWLVWDPLGPESHVASLKVWARDFQYLFEQLAYASAIFWIGSKFTETRTILTVGFDTPGAQNLSVKGPDDANTVWIGRTYKARLEAEAVVAVIEERLQQTATV